MRPKVKLDEDLPNSLADLVRSYSYDTATVREQRWGGFKDEKLWPLIRAENRFFITADKGFGDIRKFPPGTHAGILLLRPGRESIVEFRSLLNNVLNAHQLSALAGTVSVATSRGLRIRRK